VTTFKKNSHRKNIVIQIFIKLYQISWTSNSTKTAAFAFLYIYFNISKHGFTLIKYIDI